MKTFMYIVLGASLTASSAICGQSPCEVLAQIKGISIEKPAKKKSFGQRLKERLACAAELTSIQQMQMQMQRQQASSTSQTNHNGGRAKYAMDGISVGDGYYIERNGGSATR